MPRKAVARVHSTRTRQNASSALFRESLWDGSRRQFNRVRRSNIQVSHLRCGAGELLNTFLNKPKSQPPGFTAAKSEAAIRSSRGNRLWYARDSSSGVSPSRSSTISWKNPVTSCSGPKKRTVAFIETPHHHPDLARRRRVMGHPKSSAGYPAWSLAGRPNPQQRRGRA